MLAPVMTMNEGARIYAPGGRLLKTGDRLDQPGLVRAFEVLPTRDRVRPTTGRSRTACSSS